MGNDTMKQTSNADAGAVSEEEITAACTAYTQASGVLRDVIREVLIAAHKASVTAPTAEQAEGVRVPQHWKPLYNTDPVQRACGELPEGWEIEILLENGAGCVYLIDPKGERTDFDNADKFDWTIHDAIEAALAAHASSAGDQA
jgi:hypothetical protein